MPFTLRPPRKGKTPNYEIRGSYLGVRVERTTGTPDKTLARGILKDLKRSVERGEHREPQTTIALEPPPRATFAIAALAYLKAGGDAKGIGPIIEATGPHALRDMPIDTIDQIAIDNAARALYPIAAATTLNRQFYTPVSAILKRAGIERKIKRPKGWRGSKATSWLDPTPAFRVVEEAYGIEYEFGLLCETYLYTGMRLSEPLRACLRDLRLDQAMLYVPDTKNGEPRPVHLTPRLVAAYRNAPARMARPGKATGMASNGREPGKPGTRLVNGAAGRSRAAAGVPFLDRGPHEKLFRFCIGGRLRKMLKLAMTRAGVSFPHRQGGFHLFCHTYGTWMTHFGGLDTYGLVRTRRWKDPDSAERYSHTVATPEAMRADLLPVPAQKPGKIRGITHSPKKRA